MRDFEPCGRFLKLTWTFLGGRSCFRLEKILFEIFTLKTGDSELFGDGDRRNFMVVGCVIGC